jgi:hypothetical protein
MKTFALCAVCGGLAFVAVQYQMTGQILGLRLGEDAAQIAPPPPPKAVFPQALAALCRGKGVPQAAAFNKSSETHPAVVLKPSGTLHSWHKRLQPGWQAESVEETELVILVPPQKRTLLGVQTYSNGAPPIRRYQYDLDVRLLEARTGRLIAQKHFQNAARPIRPMEVWALTELGDPIAWLDVSRWMKAVTTGSSTR